MSQDTLADVMGVTKTTISSWEQDQMRPRFDLLGELREALRTSIDWIVLGEAVPTGSVAEAGAVYDATTAQPVGVDEWQVLARFRSLSARKREGLVALLED